MQVQVYLCQCVKINGITLPLRPKFYGSDQSIKLLFYFPEIYTQRGSSRHFAASMIYQCADFKIRFFPIRKFT